MHRLLLIGALAGAMAPSLAHADRVDTATQAKADLLFEKAQAHYQADEFQAAIDLFGKAYELVHDPVYLFNIAQSYRKILDCTSAYDYYTRYLADAKKDAPNRVKVEGWLRELQPCVDQRKAERDAAARGAELERQREADEASAAAKRALAMRPVTRVVDRGRGLRIAGLAVGGAGAIGLVVGFAESIHSQHIKSEVDANCADGCSWAAEHALDAAGTRANTYATVGFVAGGLAVLAGAGLYYYGHHRIETVVVAPQPGGGVASVRLRF